MWDPPRLGHPSVFVVKKIARYASNSSGVPHSIPSPLPQPKLENRFQDPHQHPATDTRTVAVGRRDADAAMSTGLTQSFLAAIQASVSVLLVLLSGAIAAHLKLIDRAATKPISKICVRIFLPALLITKVGSQLHASSIDGYLVIVIWGIAVHVVSFLVGLLGHRVLDMPDYVTPAILINNSTSYPLLLITALEDTGILDSLIVTDETTKQAIDRAKAYLLVYSTISNCVTFAVGPRLIDSEHAPEEDEEDDKVASNGNGHSSVSIPDVEANEETRLLDAHLPNSPHPLRRSSFSFSRPRDDRKPEAKPDRRRPWFMPRKRWNGLSPRVKWWFLFILDFFNAPLLGALIGAVVGLVPAFHRAFFNSSDDGLADLGAEVNRRAVRQSASGRRRHHLVLLHQGGQGQQRERHEDAARHSTVHFVRPLHRLARRFHQRHLHAGHQDQPRRLRPSPVVLPDDDAQWAECNEAYHSRPGCRGVQGQREADLKAAHGR
jgi:predicted permease